jgi:23S rRNA (cytidine2498-2'-O)-methyltransferase
MSSNGALVVCQSGFEGLLIREMAGLGLKPAESGPGWVLSQPGSQAQVDGLKSAAFPHAILEAPTRISGQGVNEIAKAIAELFTEGLRGERIEGPWPCIFAGGHDQTGLGRRISSVEAAFHELLKKKLARVQKLATTDRPRVGTVRGLFVWFTDFSCVQVARSAHMNGPCRMADDDDAPSRSYLKVEESYGIAGAEPQPGELVCDLGAAPGGWSYSAAKRGAKVVAVDNGPLKGGALNNPLIDHRHDDAFGFSPGRELIYDWLFCDMLEDPHKVIASIMTPWLKGGWCRRFVVNLKFGLVDPISLLEVLRSPNSPLSTRASGVRIVHLYHDREEFTVTGTITL